MILGLLELWMNSKVPHMDMDPPHPFHTKHTVTSLSMLVLAMIRLKGQHRKNEECL